MNLLFCILRALPGTFVHVLFLGLKACHACMYVKSLIVQEIKTDSGLAWIYMYFTLVLFHWNCQKKIIKLQKQKVHMYM